MGPRRPCQGERSNHVTERLFMVLSTGIKVDALCIHDPSAVFRNLAYEAFAEC